MTQIPIPPVQPAVMEAEETTLNGLVRDFLFVLFRHKKKILFVFFLLIIGATWFIMRMPDIYQSRATLLLRPGRESVTDPIFQDTGQVMGRSMKREQEIQSEIQIIKSQDVAQKVLDKIGGPDVILAALEKEKKGSGQGESSPSFFSKFKGWLKSLLKPIFGKLRGPKLGKRERALKILMDKLEVSNPKDTNNIEIHFEFLDPALSQKVLSALIDVYKVKHLEVHKTQGSLAFFEEQSQKLRKELDAAEEALRQYKIKSGYSSLTAMRDSLLQRLGDLRMEYSKNLSELEGTKAKVVELKATLAPQPEMVTTSKSKGGTGWTAAERMREKLFELELKRLDLLSRYSNESTIVKEVEAQIAQAKKIIAGEGVQEYATQGLNPIRQQLQQDLLSSMAQQASLEARTSILEKQWKKAQEELKAMDTRINEADFTVAQLTRKITLLKENYQRYMTNREQARIAEDLEKRRISSISVIQPPTLPLRPSKPKRLQNLILAFLLAIFGGIGTAYAFEFMDDTIRKPEEIETKLGVPLLAVIPKVKGPTYPQ